MLEITKDKPRVLFIDDEPNFQNGLRRLLRDYETKWDIEYAFSVKEGLQIIEERGIDTVIADAMMPEQTGFDLLGIMQADENLSHIPIAILTGNAEHDLKRKALDLGASDLLNKPVVLEDLVARITNMLQLRKVQMQLVEQNQNLDSEVRRRTLQVEYSRLSIMLKLAKAGEYRDEGTGNHIIRVGCYCRAIAEQMGMSRDFVQNITLASPLHDIGKIGTPDSILLKPGKLEPHEWEIMKMHCEIGADILLKDPAGVQLLLTHPLDNQETFNNPMIKMGATITRSHHEKWDGSGYPDKLVGEEIPIEACIVAVADVYDALRSERPYKKPFSHEKANEIILEGRETHFHPEIVDAYEKIQDEFYSIHKGLESHTIR